MCNAIIQPKNTLGEVPMGGNLSKRAVAGKALSAEVSSNRGIGRGNVQSIFYRGMAYFTKFLYIPEEGV